MEAGSDDEAQTGAASVSLERADWAGSVLIQGDLEAEAGWRNSPARIASSRGVALKLTHHEAFDSGIVILEYEPVPGGW